MKKVYFAGSIRGGRGKQVLYHKIIAALKEKYEVLTEHIGQENLSQFGEQKLTDEEIFKRDKGWIEECDFVIAECTVPSLGVGYELGYAESMGKLIYVLYQEDGEKVLSAMLNGNSNFIKISYKEEEDLLVKLQQLA